MIPKLNTSNVSFIGGPDGQGREQHRYILHDGTPAGRELQGITSTLVRRAYPDTYSRPENYTEEQWRDILANAARKGTAMHQSIENYEDGFDDPDNQEVQGYVGLKKGLGLFRLANEYVVTDGEHYATAIDGVYCKTPTIEDIDNPEPLPVILVDYKRTYDLHLEEVTLQLSICKRFFEKQNPHLKVAGLYVFHIRDDRHKAVEVHPVGDDILDGIIYADLHDLPYTFPVQLLGDLPTALASVEDEIIRIERMMKEYRQRSEDLKSGLLQLMDENNVRQFKSDRITLTRVMPSARESLDMARLKADRPDIWEEYKKITHVKQSIKITIKE